MARKIEVFELRYEGKVWTCVNMWCRLNLHYIDPDMGVMRCNTCDFVQSPPAGGVKYFRTHMTFPEVDERGAEHKFEQTVTYSENYASEPQP